MEKMRRIKLTRRKTRGAAAVEFALVLIPLLLIVAGIVEFGRTFWYYDALSKATRDGARYLSITKAASAPPAIDTAQKDAAIAMVVNAANSARVPGFDSEKVEVTCEPSCDDPVYVTVSINAYQTTIGEWIPFVTAAGATSWNATLSPQTTMPYMCVEDGSC